MRLIVLSLLLLVASTTCTGDDFESIFSQINRFILQQEKKFSFNLKESIESATEIKGALSRLNLNDLSAFRQEFVNIVHDFDVGTQDLGRLLERIGTNDAPVPAIIDGINHFKTYVENSLKWYSFLEKLRDDYNLQKTAQRGSDFEREIMTASIDDDNTKPLKTFEFANSISQLDPHQYKDIQNAYKTIENLEVNPDKLGLLKTVWRQSRQSVQLECQNDTLVVSGYNVLLADVVLNDCFKTAQHLKVFALNKVFFDTGLIKPSLDMAVVSPIWETIKSAHYAYVNFNGKRGEQPATAVDSDSFRRPGKPGATGHPGGWGGQFMGFGKSLYGPPFHIHLRGGRGGKGQDGGYGFDGKDGGTVPYGTDLDELKASHPYEIIHSKQITPSVPGVIPFVFFERTYLFEGTAARPGTDGGDGGCGGPGGHAGRFSSIGFENSRAFHVLNRTNGPKGFNALGGKGGSVASNGRNLQVRTVNDHIVEGGIKLVDAGSVPPGKDGVDAVFKDIIKHECTAVAPEPHAFDQAGIFNAFKHFARENLAYGVLTSELNSFIGYLDSNRELKERYDIHSLLEDFELIEDQYFELRNQISFIPYYESLVERAQIYSHKLEGDQANEKRALNYLYTAVKSRLFAIKSDANYVAVVNLLDYMNDVKDRMEEIQHSKSIDAYRRQFKTVIDGKISNANKMINQYVVPSIDDAIKRSDGDIDDLLAELFKKQNETKNELVKANKNKQTMKRRIFWHTLLAPLKLIGSALSLLGPEGAAVSVGVTEGLSIAENLIDRSLPLQKVILKTNFVHTNVEKISRLTKNYLKNAESQLEQLQKLSNEDPATFQRFNIDLSGMQQTIASVKNASNTSVFLSSDEISKLQKVGEANLKRIGAAEKQVKETDKKTSKTLKAANVILSVGSDVMGAIDQSNNDNKQLDEINSAINSLKHELQLIHQHELNIYHVMMPQMQLMEESVRTAIKGSEGKSHVELDISRWSIQITLKDVKNIFNQMSADFAVNDDLMSCISKITDGITTVIDVYDRIDSYKERTQIATLITQVAGNRNSFDFIENDDSLKEAVQKLDQKINENLVLEQYETAMTTLKQHTFPFAGHFLDEYIIPANITATENEAIQIMTQKINEIVEKLKHTHKLIEKPDFFVHDHYNFTGEDAFYVWDNNSYKDSIEKLLRGDEVVFSANIKNQENIAAAVGAMSAVKFSEIWIRFEMENEIEQRHFNEELHQLYLVNMKMVGNSYYRCHERIYYNSVEKPELFEFALDNSGEPYGRNKAADKLARGDLFLSPYTTWQISLKAKPQRTPTSSFADFSKRFADGMLKISLEGRGEFISYTDEDFLLEVCNENLDQFYRLDSIVRIHNE